MPTAEFRLVKLNDLISDAVEMFAENNPQITFNFIADNSLPDLIIDPEQVRGIMINLIDNAIEALSEQGNSENSVAKKVVVKTNYSRKRKIASFEVCDNGPGVSDENKARIFEPYYTTKSGGTGLGLAIVTSAVADHQGTIRVYDNLPRGAKFVVDLPIMQRQITQRRFAPAGS
jgi:two-component system nitrogen regulation sensor histidine kinase NtrY